MISFFDNLVIKSNPQAKEEILSLKKPLATSKPKVKECMKRSRPSSDSTQMSGNSSRTSEGIDGENPSPPKKRDTRPHKGSGGAGGKGDPPEKPDKPGDSKVDNTEIIQELLEELMVLLDQIRAKFEKMIVELNPEAQRILSKKFNEFYQRFWEEIQKFNQLPSNTSIEEINEIHKKTRDIIERCFKEQIVSEINSYILKRSHNHAELRGDNPHLPYKDEHGKLKINKKPKKAQLLERNNALDLEGKTPSRHSPVIHKLQTPFGTVDIRIIGIDPGGHQIRIITPKGDPSGPLYTEINTELKNYAASYPGEMQDAFNAIENYLKSPLVPGDNVENVLSNLNSGVKPFPTEHATKRQRTLLAVLAGILLLCESGEDRSNQGGKRERALISDLKKMVNSPEDLFTHYVPADAAVLDKTVRPPKIKQYGGNLRGKVQVGKVKPNEVGKIPISEETLQSDKERTGHLEFSSDSEKDYDVSRDIFEIEDRKYRTTDNPGPNGSCLWRILIKHHVTEEHLKTAATNLGIRYNDFVNMENLELLLSEINRLGDYNLAFHIDVFNYLCQYQESISGNIPASLSAESNIIYIALIYDHTSGDGHYVEKLS